jgi:hypothetical protein
MSSLLRTRRRTLVSFSLLATIGLVAGVVGFAVEDASGTTVPGLGSLDHFLCYSAAATPTPAAVNVPSFPHRPQAAWLQNQFGSLLGHVGALQQHCNPVQKTLPDGTVTPINKPNDHLTCWAFDANPNTPPPLVNVTNQFSPTDAAGNPTPVPLVVGPLRSLCLPTFKSLTSANLPPDGPHDLDHYSCYAVKYATNTSVRFVPPNPPKQAGVTLDDQFTDLTSPHRPLKVFIGEPDELCLPTIKIINPDPLVPPPTIQKLLDANDHLVCFAIRALSPAVRPHAVFDGNQFGTGRVAIKRPDQLCVPSLKTIPNQPTTTTTASTTTSVPCPAGTPDCPEPTTTTTTCDPATGADCSTTTTNQTPTPAGP